MTRMAPSLGPLQPIACLFGWHRRDHRRMKSIEIDGKRFHIAHCTGCQTPLIKRGGRWRVRPGGIDSQDAAASQQAPQDR